MTRLLSIVALLATGTAAHATSPLAEVICDERDALRMTLQRSFGARQQGRGMRGPDAIVEIWTVPSTGEWTIVQSYANGRSCIVAMGENWEGLLPDGDPA